MTPLVLGLHVGGCASWQPQAESPSTVIAERRPDRVRLTLRDGERVTVGMPRLEGDSVAGGTDPDAGRRIAISDVTVIELRRVQVANTAAVVLLAGALIYLASLACFGLVSPCHGAS